MAWMLEHSINVAVSLRKLKHNIGIMTIVILPDGFPNRVHQIKAKSLSKSKITTILPFGHDMSFRDGCGERRECEKNFLKSPRRKSSFSYGIQESLPNTELALAMCEAISSSLWISLESKLPKQW
ncbi:uncharacterized protein ACOB8E_008770 isoform 1-T1 [Sarcophilus harrisii]